MKFLINGEIKNIAFQEVSPNLASLIDALDLNPKIIIVEFNGVILNQQNWKHQQVSDEDRLEIVTVVGGG